MLDAPPPRTGLPGSATPSPTDANLSTAELLGRIAQQATQLARAEVELARVELRADLKRGGRMLEGLGVALVGALLTLSTLLVAAVLALATRVPGWGAALIVAGATLVATVAVGLYGWARRVRQPLGATVRTLVEDLRWTRERLA